MPTRCILIPTANGVDPTRRLDVAARLGRSLHAHLNVIFISPVPARRVAGLPKVAVAAGMTEASVAAEAGGAARVSKAKLQAWCASNNIPLSETQERLDATFATWAQAVGELEVEVALAGRINDLTVVDKPDLSKPFTESAFDAAVFSSGRPVLVVPRKVPNEIMSHVVIAWNGSVEAARTIGQSISLLHEAERVTIIEVATPQTKATSAADLSAYLRYHGIVAHRRIVERDSFASVGEKILAVSEQVEGSMLVMGAYTHSRIREFLLGGVTQHMLDRAEIPILMTH